MAEIIFLKLLPIIVSVAIIGCHLTESERDIVNKTDCKNLLKIKEIEMWLTKIDKEEFSRMRGLSVPPDEDACQPLVEGCNIGDLSDYNSPLVDVSNHAENTSDTFTNWYAKITRQAAKLLNENKDILETHNKTALRLLHLYSIGGALVHPDPKKRVELRKAKNLMLDKFLETMANGSKTCPQRPRVYKLELHPQNCSVLKCIWESWHNEVAMAVKDDFRKMVELSNKAAKENGYNDTGEVWKIADVEDLNAEREMKRLLDGVMPIYEQLHAYVRRKVYNYYSNDSSCGYQRGPDEPIPAHLTGNLIGQEWTELESLVLPYPEATLPNFTRLVNSLKLDQNHMAREAEKFFTSLGFRPMTKTFWKISTFNATAGGELGCVARASDNLDDDGYKIYMCESLTLKNFGIIHHEMGHIVAYMESEQLPYKFRHGVNGVFHEGFGDSLALSALAPDHLKKIFNLSKDELNEKPGDTIYERDINALMRSALYILPLLPYSYVLEMWRYRVFRGHITPKEYNRSWWKMRNKYQGIDPPFKRSMDHFDPGSIIHVAYNIPYGQYYLSLFVAFQMHEALCKSSNHKGPLHQCDIYQSKVAGKKLSQILKQGGSKTTVELLNELTGDEGYRFEPILEYYKPLHEWLKKQNKGHTVKWNKNFTME